MKTINPDIFTNGITLITGYTGSGKTTLAKYFCNVYPKVIIYNVNYDDNYDGVRIYDTISLYDYLSKNYYQKFIHIVYDNEIKDLKDFNFFCEIVKEYARVCVIYEEVNLYASSYFISTSLKININTGRHYNLTQFFICQRVNKVNGDILSQARCIISFRQLHHRDLYVLSPYFKEEDLKNLDKYEFLLWTRQDNTYKKCMFIKDKIIIL